MKHVLITIFFGISANSFALQCIEYIASEEKIVSVVIVEGYEIQVTAPLFLEQDMLTSITVETSRKGTKGAERYFRFPLEFSESGMVATSTIYHYDQSIGLEIWAKYGEGICSPLLHTTYNQ